MKVLKAFLVFAVLLSLSSFVGCSASRQFLDPTWTEKPSKIKVLFTEPILPKDTIAPESTDPISDRFFNKKVVLIPEGMKPISDWFKDKVSNTFTFNTKAQTTIEEIPGKDLSHAVKNMDGTEVHVPKIETMSDSFDVYIVLDSIKMDINEVVNTLSDNPTITASGQLAVNQTLTFKGETTRMSGTYAIYDVKTGKPLAYGFLDEKLYHKDIAAEHGWYDMVRQFILRVIEKTPVAI
ncbi:MAG: hypothetical protein HUK21_12965 [Fibrobacteraceae bacterium]|nr:hypothetical protein [Fibrobacteraceae bacterium]